MDTYLSPQELSAALMVHEELAGRGLRVSVAESVTGGLVGHILTSLPGASNLFVASLVTYTNQSKAVLLGVRKPLIKEHGAVSAEVARAMAEGVQKKTGTEVALATTGNAGPDALEGKPVGMVYLAVSTGKQSKTKKLELSGTREEIKRKAAVAALKFLLEVIRA